MDREFYEIMQSFEITAPKLIRTGHEGFKRENKEHWKHKFYYCDEKANNAFKMFFAGVSLGKLLVRLDADERTKL